MTSKKFPQFLEFHQNIVFKFAKLDDIDMTDFMHQEVWDSVA